MDKTWKYINKYVCNDNDNLHKKFFHHAQSIYIYEYLTSLSVEGMHFEKFFY